MRYDFAIIGAGIAGASVASELAGSARVLLIERESQPGYHATGRSAAMYIETYGNRTVRGLIRAGRDFFHNPPAGFCDHPLLSPRGGLFIGRTDQEDALDAHYRKSVTITPTITRHDASFALARVPVLKRGHVAGCIWEPDAMDIDVHALHQGYLRRLRGQGGRLATDAGLEGLAWRGDHWRIETRAGLFDAAVVVNAAGAWADEIAGLAGAARLGLEARRRTVVLFDPPAEMTISKWPFVIDIDESFYFKPDAGKILASPADETPVPPCDVQPEEMDVAVALDRIERATTMAPRRLDHKWAGLRTFAPDETPVVGFDPKVAGLFWLAGQGGSGIQSAPALARIAAALVQKGAIPADIGDLGVERAALDPARFSDCAAAAEPGEGPVLTGT
jgi:D-arginine dehydrogenase